MWLYQILLVLMSPIILRKIWRFHKTYPDYQWQQALGVRNAPVKADLWIHCASVGEVLGVRPLVSAWLASHPDKTLMITTMTPTGAEQVVQSFSGDVIHRYLPMDYPYCVGQFLRQLDVPQLMIMETELWPNLLRGANRKNIKISLINARMSERSFRRYQQFSFISKPLMQCLDAIYAHNDTDAERFRSLGASSVISVGNIKFDLKVPENVFEAEWRSQVQPKGFVWVAASTHEGEERMALQVHQTLLKTHPDAMLIVVPRHPERFDEVAKLMSEFSMNYTRRSVSAFADWADRSVVIGDSMGELLYYFHVADVAFVGGSLIERGGHNPIEPALMSLPVLVGPHTFNFEEITRDLLLSGGGECCANTEALLLVLKDLADHQEKRQQMGGQARLFALRNAGAVERLLSAIDRIS